MKGFPDEFAHCTGFEWDAGNADKNWELHEVTRGETEETFFNQPLVVAPDAGHSGHEHRYAALGRTEEGRRLTIIYFSFSSFFMGGGKRGRTGEPGAKRKKIFFFLFFILGGGGGFLGFWPDASFFLLLGGKPPYCFLF